MVAMYANVRTNSCVSRRFVVVDREGNEQVPFLYAEKIRV